VLLNQVEKDDVGGTIFQTTAADTKELVEAADPFARSTVRPGYLSIGEIKDHVPRIESESESRSFLIALEKRYSTLVLPFVIALFTAPFAFSLHRKARAAGVGYAVLIWLLFTAASSIFEQFWSAGHLTPQLAIWSPLLIFASLGLYRVARIPT
jgi:lipopolysaccharide export LptBFGC system permease protein LptF